jgi:cysteate synthase
MAQKYQLRCLAGNETMPDTGQISCQHGHNALLRAEYASRQLVLSDYPGIYRYIAWLPVEKPLLPSGGPVTFTCKELGRTLGLSRLFVSFSGYFPEQGAELVTGSFKELEASPTMQRLQEHGRQIPVVASAGNTGRAFAQLSARCRKQVVIVVPKRAADRLWTTARAEDIFLVTVDGDYTDAIDVSGSLAAVPGCVPEGGAKNVARRDGMGTVMLDAAVTIGRIPDHYFQAVGSGTGAIAAWEAALRLISDGRYGASLPQLHLAQNEPFIPMASAWRDRRREIVPEKDMPDADTAVFEVMSEVLTNRSPPFGIAGGLFDALTETDGLMYTATNAEGTDAMKLVRETVGIDPDPAAAIATAALVKAAEAGIVKRDATILLNLTGGGYERIREDHTLYPVKVSAGISPGAPREALIRELKEWIAHHG